MKKEAFAVALAACVAVSGFAQGATVSVQNEENVPFYYVVDPADLAGISAGSPLMASRVASFFAASDPAPVFAQLSPGATASLTGLPDGSHLLVGFFAVQGLTDFPVRVLSLQADGLGERFYAIFASPAQLSVPRGTGRLAGFPGRQAPEGTETVVGGGTGGTGLPQVASFPPGKAPVSYTREGRDGFTVLPISASRGWPLTGTRISSVSGLREKGGLRIALTVPGGFSENVSYFLYVFASRVEGKTNAFTLEIQPRADGSRGAVILWSRDAGEPRLVGTVKTVGETVEVSVGAQDLDAAAASGVPTSFGDCASMDLTSAWYDRALGTWEEFFYATLNVVDFPVTR